MIASDFRNAYNRTKWALVLRGLVSLAVGIAIFARPIASVAALALVIALWSLFDGIVNITRSFSLRGIVQHWWVVLVTGIVSFGFGVAALYYFPGLSLAFAVIWTAYWLTFSGAIAIGIAWMERGAGVPWGWTMAFGAIAIVGGIVALMNPGATLATLVGLLSGFAIISGIFLLIGAGRMLALQSDVRQAMPAATRA
jgi:uncharacterized membrane protein HdeD (DUF308 family)